MVRNMDFRPLFTSDFWFDMTPTAMGPAFERITFVIFALFILAGAVLRIQARKDGRDKYDRLLFHKAATNSIVLGIFGLVIYFFTYEEISFFGSRFWYLIWLIALVWCVVRFVRFMKREVPVLRQRDASRADANKYLPRRS